MLGVLTYLIVAQGHAPSKTSGSGAMAEISKQPTGPFLLAVLSAGLLAYGIWRLIQVVTGVEPSARDDPSAWKRFGWLVIAAIYFALFSQAVSLIAGSGGSGGPSNHPQPYAAKMLSWPAGPELVGAVGAGVVIGGLALAIWGCVHNYSKVLAERQMKPAEHWAARITGIFGNVTRGVLVVLVGIYLLLSAVDDKPGKVKSLDQLLETIVHGPAGPWWLTIAATGLIAFAAYSGFEARYRRI